MQFKKFIRNHFFNDDYEIQHRLLNVILFATIVGVVFALGVQVVFQNDVLTPIVMLFCIVIAVIVLWIANFLHHPQVAAIILSVVMNDILLPSLFLISGGIESGMMCWCLGGFILSFLLIKGKKAYVMFLINIAGFLTAFIHSYFRPEIITPMVSLNAIYIDVGTTIIIVALILSSVYRYGNIISENQTKKISEANEIAQKATKAKTEFLSKMSHDIRTPMNTIVGFTELAKREIDDKEKVLDSLAKISLSSNHLLNLMNDILDMSRIESGRIYFEEENCSLKALIENCCQILENDFAEKKIVLKKDYSMLDEDLICCDKLRMNQVLLNLLTNSVKYSYPNGTVELSVIQLTGDDEEKINTEIHVKDNGVGMTEEYKQRLFIPFERDKIGLETGIVGTGLGLAITKNLVENMGGTVEVESEEGKGTEITISIPFSVPILSELEEDKNLSKFDFKGYKLLLVDDNELHREIEVKILKEVGFDVEIATDGSSAFKKHNESNYDIILMDLVMPIMDGYQATKLIRAMEDPSLAKTPIVAITANAYSDDKSQAFEAGMNAYVTKPFNKIELMEVLKLILKESSISI